MPIIHLAGTQEDLSAGRGEVVVMLSEAAAVAGIAPKTLCRLVEEGKVTPYEERIVNSMVFLLKDMRQLREERTKRY